MNGPALGDKVKNTPCTDHTEAPGGVGGLALPELRKAIWIGTSMAGRRASPSYRCPGERNDLAREGKTRYLTPRVKATIFPGAETIKLNDVTDGTSNTIMVVEAGDANAVIWTKPDDWQVDPEPTTAGVFQSHTGSRGKGTGVGYADGSVRFLHETISPRLLRALLTPNGGEIVSPDDL